MSFDLKSTLCMDLRGNVTEWVSGNGLTSNRYYDPATGRLKTLDTSMLASFGVVQDHEYDWDDIGNLTERTRTTGSNTLQETFVYDGLNRLRHVKVGGAIQQNIQYYKNGNIKSKTGVGTYTYGNNAGPHAVTNTSTGNISYTYDANGNMTSDTSGRSLQYTTFDKPKLISKGGHTTEFKYGPNRARYLRTDTDSNGTTVTRYIGSVEKVTKADGSQVIKRYIGDALVTISKSSSGTETARTTQYLYKDHLGSLDVIVEGGNTQEYRFDAWGQRINPSTSAVLANIATDINFSVANIATTRGFTGREMLDQVGLIHMNGRIYDPRLGRFLQADPFVQFLDNTQSYNRYSYVMNNPLRYTDPSGYFSFGDFVKSVVQTVITVVVSYYCPPCGAALAYGFAKMNGATSGQAFFAAAMAWIGGEMAQPGTTTGVSEGGAMAASDVASQATAEHLAGNTVSSEAIAAGANQAGYTLEEVVVTATRESAFNSGIAIQVAGVGLAGLTPANFEQPTAVKDNSSCTGRPCNNAGARSKQSHFARNVENDQFLKDERLYGRNDLTIDEVEGAGEYGMKQASPSETKFHRNGPGNEHNLKYTSKVARRENWWQREISNRYGRYEIILRPNDNGTFTHVTESLNMGTLNYGSNPLTHFTRDIVPYWRHGNTPQ
ncbi:hypothetical protein G8764_16830 [Pseudomaricurvus alcaniphilus]|uniref:RHS repeat domain-containing protein n=1 Tax=Pseudomaricurvus alcaniphilus TaxID=1166482 RepID=UPI00140CB0F4|nr:RHS repeat-associated core domain-containing protein [Pseudomaricurvus alcaniphilus]NHN38976.1 hypothetical protein [Pseudomaricurvus alcaniphilus]